MALEFVSGFVVSSLLQELVDKIKASVADTIALAYSSDVEGELKNLEVTCIKALSKLNDVDGWDLISSKPHRDWVADIRRACYEAEDFMECLKLEIIKTNGDAGFFRSYWTKWGLSSKVRDLQKTLITLTDASDQFTNRCHGGGRDERWSKEPMTVPDHESFRRKKEKESIIGQLLLHPNNSCVVLIAGIFGVGKTTLAQVVKNDSRIQNHFDHKLWVSVSGDFNLKKVLCSMILDLQVEQRKEVNPILFHPFPEQQYARLFQGLCKGRKVLIVLDDLCNFVNTEDWEYFQSLVYPSCVLGILITTRNPKVTTMVSSLSSVFTTSYFLPLMSDEDCGLILRRKVVSAAGTKRMHCGRSISELIAVQIAEKYCKGLPLVANVIGHNLFLKQEDSLSIKLSNDFWSMPEFRELIFPAFRLNYSNLSFFLKNCIPYFSLFPKEYNHTKDDLVRLWLAEGYVKPPVAGLQDSECSDYIVLEEHGNYYFNQVLSQSILHMYHPFDQEPQIYKMHEFIHRYAQFMGSDMYVQLDEHLVDACSLGNVNGASGSASNMLASAHITTQYKKFRHLSLLCSSIPTSTWKDIERHSKGLRTILSLRDRISIGQLSYTLFLKLQSLRVLNLSGTDINELPESVGKLKHLRLLDVSKTNIQEFPASTSDLYMLQVLKADQCPLLLQLPKMIKRLTSLLHLEVDIINLNCMPRYIGELCNLRTLPAFVVGRKDGLLVSELQNLNHLQGSICLMNLELVKNEREAKEAMLRNKPFLKRLELEWTRHSTNALVIEKIFSALEPHENLEELQITGYYGFYFPSWLCSSQCKLTSIHLLRCAYCQFFPALGLLQHLKALYIEEMHRVEYIDKVGRFPSLEILNIRQMKRLKRWDGLQETHMPHLRELNIIDCPKLVALPALNFLGSLVNLEISYCPVVQALPEGGLPLSLQTLIITNCDMLKQRCSSEQGADWKKIIGVCKVVIDFVQLPTT